MERAHAAPVRLRIDSTHDRVGGVPVRRRPDDAGSQDMAVPGLRVPNGRRLRGQKQSRAATVSDWIPLTISGLESLGSGSV